MEEHLNSAQGLGSGSSTTADKKRRKMPVPQFSIVKTPPRTSLFAPEAVNRVFALPLE